MRLLYLAAVLVGLALPTSLSAQGGTAGTSSCGTDASIPFAKVAMPRLCALTKDTAVKRVTGATDAVSLIAAMPHDIMWRVDDTALADFLVAFSESLGFVSAEACATMLPTSTETPWAQRFMGLATSIDSTMALRWTAFLEAWVRAKVAGAPRGREATASQVSAYVRRYYAHLEPAEQAEYLRLGRHQVLAPSEQCNLVRGLLVRLGSLPPTEAGPLIRAMMSGRYSWFPEA